MPGIRHALAAAPLNSPESPARLADLLMSQEREVRTLPERNRDAARVKRLLIGDEAHHSGLRSLGECIELVRVLTEPGSREQP